MLTPRDPMDVEHPAGPDCSAPGGCPGLAPLIYFDGYFDTLLCSRVQAEPGSMLKPERP